MEGVALVTGASAGVGRATARRLAEDGYDLALVARGRQGLDGARVEVERLGRRAIVIPADVADEAQVEEAAERAESTLGPIDIWVNNAATTVFSPFREMDADEFRRVLEVSYLGAVWGTRAALKRMQPRDRGTIVFVGSALAYRGIPLQSAYCGAKHAVKGFFESAAAGAADLPAGGRRGRDRVGRAQRRARALRRRLDLEDDLGGARRARIGGPLPRQERVSEPAGERARQRRPGRQPLRPGRGRPRRPWTLRGRH